MAWSLAVDRVGGVLATDRTLPPIDRLASEKGTNRMYTCIKGCQAGAC